MTLKHPITYPRKHLKSLIVFFFVFLMQWYPKFLALREPNTSVFKSCLSQTKIQNQAFLNCAHPTLAPLGFDLEDVIKAYLTHTSCIKLCIKCNCYCYSFYSILCQGSGRPQGQIFLVSLDIFNAVTWIQLKWYSTSIFPSWMWENYLLRIMGSKTPFLEVPTWSCADNNLRVTVGKHELSVVHHTTVLWWKLLSTGKKVWFSCEHPVPSLSFIFWLAFLFLF